MILQKKILFFLAFLLVVFTTNYDYAQYNALQFSSLTYQNDISLNIINKIIQDKAGFIWVGTDNGLLRYDGYKFEYFVDLFESNKTLTKKRTTDIVEDNERNLWIATTDGLKKYNYTMGKFKVYKNDKNNPTSISSNLITRLLVDNDGLVWICTNNGLNKYNKDTDNFTVIKKVTDELHPRNYNTVLNITEDDNDRLWLGTWNGLSIMAKDGELLETHFTNSDEASEVDFMKISALLNDGLGNIYLGFSDDGVIIFDQKTREFNRHLQVSKNPNTHFDGSVISFMKDNNNNIWIGTSNGLIIYEPKNNNITRYFAERKKKATLLGNDIRVLFQDNSGLIWIGTSVGVNKYFQSPNNFKYLQKNDNNPSKGLTANTIIGVHVNKKNDDIWVSTMNGLNKIKASDNRIEHFYHKPNNPNSISNNFVRTVLVDQDDFAWIGTNYHGLNKYNPYTKKIYTYKYSYDSTSLSAFGIVAIHEDKRGDLWFGTWWGLNKYNRKSNNFVRYFSDNKNENALIDNLIWVIDEDDEGNLWVGTESGVSCFDPISVKFTNFSSKSLNNKLLASDRIIDLKVTSNNIVWFGTYEGITVYDIEADTATYFTKADGLPSNRICSIEEDLNGTIWIATDKGLAMFDKENNRFYNFSLRDGLHSNIFQQNCSALSSDGNLYFASDGLVSFNPNEIKPDSLTAPIVFTDLKIYNESVSISDNGILQQPIMYQKVITIPPYNDMISIDFALLDYYNASNNTYRYLLEGFDINWIDAGRNNSATYTNLSAGEYKFRVKAKNNSGINNEVEASIVIIVEPRFYQTWWFITYVVILIASISTIIIRQRIIKIEAQNKILEQTVEERTKDLDNTVQELNLEIATKDKFFSIIAHDLRSPFTSLLGSLEYMVKENKNIDREERQSLVESLYRSARLTFDLLEHLLMWARIQTNRIDYNPVEINLYDAVFNCVELFRNNAKKKKIEFVIDVSNQLIIYADFNMIETVIRNLISNAIKFTPFDGSIVLKAKDDNAQDKIELIVKDSGVGISKENIDKLFYIGQNVTTLGTAKEKGTGLGLILCKEFVEYNKGSISIRSDIGEGTEISILLPKKTS